MRAPSRPGLSGTLVRQVVVVGVGRLGGALSLGLRRAGWPVSVLPRPGEARLRAVALRLRLADEELLRAAHLCLFAVPDRALAAAVLAVHPRLSARAALVHCAGALDLSAFGSMAVLRGHPRASFHPLCAISDSRDPLSGHSVAFAASRPSLRRSLLAMARALGLEPIEIPERRRPVYHAGAVMSAGLAVALLSCATAAFGRAGVGEAAALSALLPLMRSALRGVELRGLRPALTGPIARGDVLTLRAHLRALPPELKSVYCALSRRSLALVAKALPADVRRQLDQLLSPRSRHPAR